MKKWIFSMVLVFSVSISNSDIQKVVAHDHDHVPMKFNPSESDYLPPESITSTYLKVVPMKIVGFKPEALKKLNLAFNALEAAVNSEEFKDRVINFKNMKGERSFASNKGLSNEEIYQQFMEGKETLQQQTPGEMNYYLRLYHRPWSRVIGYTSPTTNVISINWKYFKRYGPSSVASNLAHEWVHKIGFDHKSAKEHDSVPYAIGYIVGDIAEKFIKKNQLH